MCRWGARGGGPATARRVPLEVAPGEPRGLRLRLDATRHLCAGDVFPLVVRALGGAVPFGGPRRPPHTRPSPRRRHSGQPTALGSIAAPGGRDRARRPHPAPPGIHLWRGRPVPRGPRPGAVPEAYTVLHAALVESWRSRPVVSNVVYSMYTFLTAVAGLVVNLAAGGCVVLWTVLLIAYMLFLLFVDLVNLGVANQQISAVTDLYQDAIRDIRELRRAADAASAPHLLSASLRNHDLVLTSYLAVDRYKARLFGAAVSHGLTRTAVVTGFTVALGLWTLLKGAGVTFTMDMACPIS